MSKALDYFSKIVPLMYYGRKPLILIFIGRIGVAIASLVTVRISTTILNPTQIGSLSELNSLIYLFNLVLIAPVGHYINRGFLEWIEDGFLLKYIKQYFIYILGVSIFCFLLTLILQSSVKFISGFDIFETASLIFFMCLLQPIYNFSVSGLNMLGERSRFVFFSNLIPWSSLFFSVFIFFIVGGIYGWGLGQVIGLLLGISAFYFLHKKINNVKIGRSLYEDAFLKFSFVSIFSFSWPLVLTSIFWWLQSNSYRFILDRVDETATVGLFATAYGLAATPIAMYESVASQYLDPIFYSDLKKKDTGGQIIAWNNYAKLYLPGLVLTGIFVASATPFMARVLLGDSSYRVVAMKITAYAAVIETFRATGSLMFHLGMAKVDNRLTMIPVAAGAIFAPLMVFILSRIDPLYGTIAGLFIAALIVLILILILSKKVLPISWPLRSVCLIIIYSFPLIISFSLMSYYIPSPSLLVSIIMLLIGSIYTLLLLAYLMMKR